MSELEQSKSPPSNLTNGSIGEVIEDVSQPGEALVEESALIIKEDEQCGCRVRLCSKTRLLPCGILQPLATAKWALFLVSVSNVFQQTVIGGLYGVSISTLEKRFELRSTESGMIGAFYDFARSFGLLVLMFAPKDIDKPRLFGWGTALAGIGAIFFSMPHFAAPEYTFVKEEDYNFCNNVTDSHCGQSAIRDYWGWFVVSICLVGLGASPMFAHGITYLDESVKKKNSAFYNGIYFASGGLGPAIGFLCGGAAMNWYTNIATEPEELTIDSHDSLWVGAWWIGFLVCGITLILLSCPLLMLPKFLPGTERHRRDRNKEAHKTHLTRNVTNNKSGLKRTMSEVWLLMKNKPYLLITLGMTMNNALIYGFNTFGAKYMESVFGLDPFMSSVTYGSASITAAVGAQFLSGYLIKKFELDVKGILKMIITTAIISAICSFGFIVHCDGIDFAGGTVPYPNSSLLNNPASTCNMDCGCSTDRFQPVCADGITYFSPCFAGCRHQINETAFADCSCVASNNNTATPDIILSSESCDSNSCDKFQLFVVVIICCFFMALMSVSPAIQVTLRCVDFDSRDMALLFQGAIIRLFGVIPGRILFGFVLDAACATRSTECGEQGSCKAYRRWEVARNSTALLLAQTVFCAIFYALVYRVYEPASGDDDKNPKIVVGNGGSKEAEDKLLQDEQHV